MIKRIIKVFLSFLVAIALFMPVNIEAASSCQGLSAGRCKSNSRCVWVKAHSRKGKSVKAYCRAKPTRSGVKKKNSITKKRSITKKKKTEKKRKVVKKKKRKTTAKKKTRKKKRTK